MAVGDIRPKDLPRIIWRECRAALLCGGTLAVMASPLITTIVDTTTLLIYFNIAKVLLHL